MSANRSKERAVLEAAQRYAGLREGIEARRSDPSRPGDVFVIAGAEVPVEWVLLETDARNPHRVFVVPADLSLLAGTADVAVPEGAPGGPLTLRCGLGLWLDAGRLRPGNRTGAVDAVHVDRALDRCRSLAEGRGAGGEAAREVDRDPEYRDWLDEVRRQVETLRARGSAARRPWSWTAAAGLRAAAAVLLVTAVGLGVALDRSSRDAAALRRERQSWEEEQRRQQEAWDRERRQLEEAYARRAEARTEGTPRGQGSAALPGVVVNVPFVWLSPRGPVRGQPESLALGGEARFVMLILEVEEPGRYGAYRLEITSERSGAAVFRAEGLKPTPTAELAIALPGSLLSAGSYRLRVLGSHAGRAQPVHEYALRVERAKAPSASLR